MNKSAYSVLVFWSLLSLQGVVFGIQEYPVKVDLKAGDAVRSLQELSAQAELQLIYPSDSLAGVKTQAIRGNYLPSVILEKLLEGTSFIAVRDGETGAFAIVRRTASVDESQGAQPQNNQLSLTNNQTDNQTIMNRNTDDNTNLLKRLLQGVLGLSLLGSAPAIAQEDAEEVYELTPFEISAAESSGYVATSTLAGTRLRMNLNDVGSSISVFTEELMNDIGAVDNETLLAYGLGTEVGGTRGNFINPNTEGLENENLLDPQSNNRIRGLTNADTTRNYFKSDVPWDGYNTYRIDVQRGANSILFGLGSPAGIINNTTRDAGFYNENKLSVTFDKFSSRRLSGSFNRVLLEDQLAIRLDFLFDNKNFRQEPAYDNDERTYLSAVYSPAALNSDTTSFKISANFEHGKIRANRPRMVVPLDFIQDYFIPAGENGFEGADFANGGKYGPNRVLLGPGARNYSQANAEEALLLANNIRWLVTAPNGGSNPIFAFDSANPDGDFSVYQDGVSSIGSYLRLTNGTGEAQESAIVVNDGLYQNPWTNAWVSGVTQNVFQAQRLVTNGKLRTASDNGLAFPGFWRDPSISDTNQFDFMNYLIDGDNKLEQQNFDVLEINVRNTFFENRLGYQLSYFKQELDFRQDANTGTIYAPSIQVEANSNNPLSDDGVNFGTNPNAGRAFLDYELRLSAGSEDIRNRDAKQAQVFATLDTNDFSDNETLTYIFGKHDFTGLVKNSELERFRREFNSIGPDEATIRTLGGAQPDDPSYHPPGTFNPALVDPGPGSRIGPLQSAFGNVQPRIRVYLEAKGPNLTQLQPFTSPVVESGSYQMTAFDATPLPGFTAEIANQPWTTPTGGDSFQANNPANYVGISTKTIGIRKATDGPDALEYLTSRRFYDFEDVDTKALVWSGSFLNNALVGMYGWREDEVQQYSLEHNFSRVASQNATGQTGGPVFDPNSSWRRLSEGEFQSRNWSVKLNASRLFFDLTGMDDNLPFDVAFLYNEGEVQSPQPGRRNVLLNDLAPATGTTVDKSIAISTKDGRFSLRYTDYETIQANANAGSVAASENWRIEQVLSNSVINGAVWIEENREQWASAVFDNGDAVADPFEVNAARTAFIQAQGFASPQAWGQSLVTAYRAFEDQLFNQWPATRSWITRGAPGTNDIAINFPDDTVFIEDNESFGSEIEFMARPTPNWNIAINASETQVLRSKVFGEDVNEVLDFIVENLAGKPGDMPLWGPNGQFGRDRVAPFLGQLITNRALLGTPTGELRKWKYNLITNYDFTEGMFQGFGIGTGLRYEDSQVIGFPPRYVDPVTGEVLPDRSLPTAALSVDIENPYRDSSRLTHDLWLKYGRKLSDKIDWRIQLNIFNITDDKGTVPLWVNPDGTYGTLGIREGRSWQVSNTFEF